MTLQVSNQKHEPDDRFAVLSVVSHHFMPAVLCWYVHAHAVQHPPADLPGPRCPALLEDEQWAPQGQGKLILPRWCTLEGRE